MKLKAPIAALLLATMPACAVTAHVSPAQYVPKNAPARIVVMDQAGLLYVLDRPTVVGENLRGIEAGTVDTVSLAVSRVVDATISRKSPVRTAILVGALTSVAGAAVIFGRGGKGNPCKLISDKENVVGFGTLCEEGS